MRRRPPSSTPFPSTTLSRSPLSLAAVLLSGRAALWAGRGRAAPPLTLLGALQTVLAGLVGLDGPYSYGSRFFAAFYPAALLALGVVGLVALAVLLFRPLAAARRPHTEEDWAHAERLVHT